MPGEGRDVEVGAEHAGRRLDQVLAELLGTSRSRAAARIDDGDVRVDGDVRPRSHRLGGGELLAVRDEEPVPVTPPPPLPPVLYRDDHLLVLDKPAGLVVHPGHGHPDGTLVDALVAAGEDPEGGDPARPGIVHRLDKDTSGAMLVALDAIAHDGLVRALAAREVRRSYLAVVEKTLPAVHGTIDVPLGRDPSDRTRFAGRADGRRAVTHFRVQAEGRLPNGVPAQLVACRLETGRTHQIRVHLAHAGAPVLGDRTYGASASASSVGLSRPFLHALHLHLVHPSSGEILDVEAPLPVELTAVLETLGIDPAGATADAVTWPPGG
ncbi:RluA family pseudouridine synthase [Salsipaludibacter albus]|uniref:RluA family pseudouridine synthase n=1 Tax=Salsipaludibacter albus TaxID=2849650 RepID=UPI001EE4312B|nr:RluA family pseudouridine synthase [Salsipaludibacter albus]